MKKIVAMMLALMLVLVSVSAMAATVSEPSSVATTFSITKAYVKDMTPEKTEDSEETPAAETAVISPSETLAFSIVVPEGVTNPDNNTTIPTITVKTNTTTGVTTGFDINIPAYHKVGLYEYTITETAGTSQGAVYNTNPMTLKVFVEYDTDDETHMTLLESHGLTIKNGDDSKKQTELQNEYNVGNLTVKKTISGNLASREAEFNMTVTFTAQNNVNSDITVSKSVKLNNDTTPVTTIGKGWTGTKSATFTLHADEEVTFTNIPVGVTYTFTEDAAHKLASGGTIDPNGDIDKDYTVTGEVTTPGKIEADETAQETINNDKNYTPDTGIALETVPYLMIMAIALMGAAMMIVRRREEM